MYLNTTGLGEWSVKNWVFKNKNGIVERRESVLADRETRSNIYEEYSDFLREFLNSLNKLPAHYYRKDTTKQYLEQDFQPLAQLHKKYKNQCTKNGKACLSITKLSFTVRVKHRII